VAYFYSLILLFIPGLGMHVYFETAAVIITLIKLGKLLESRTKGRTGGAIKKLIGLRPKSATLWENGIEREVALSQVKIGDILMVHPGESIPVDGVVLESHTVLEEYPSKVETDPYGVGWLVRIRVDVPAQLDELMTAAQYARSVGPLVSVQRSGRPPLLFAKPRAGRRGRRAAHRDCKQPPLRNRPARHFDRAVSTPDDALSTAQWRHVLAVPEIVARGPAAAARS
jgi:hypothetical protein